jgi:hypothetical protein
MDYILNQTLSSSFGFDLLSWLLSHFLLPFLPLLQLLLFLVFFLLTNSFLVCCLFLGLHFIQFLLLPLQTTDGLFEGSACASINFSTLVQFSSSGHVGHSVLKGLRCNFTGKNKFLSRLDHAVDDHDLFD